MKNKLLIFTMFLFMNALNAKVWKVGPSRTYQYCSQVAALVQPGDTVQIDYAIYQNDKQVLWTVDNLFLVGVGGRPRLEAGVIIANDANNGKGIFVISGANVHVHNIEFANAVVKSNNGAGIRQEGRNLWVTQCKFDANEMGILCGNIANCKTTVEYSEFLNGGSVANPGFQHNIYINHIDTLVFRYNYSHNALAEGHELKSRANYNFILYNRIANETTIDSRNIDLPNGGTALVMGNVIEQNQNSSNSNMLGYGLEGLTNTVPHKLYVVNNTFVNKKTTGSFINIANSTALLFVKNNIFAGAKTGGLIIGSASTLDSSNNAIADNLSVFKFKNVTTYDYHLLASSSTINQGVAINTNVQGYSLIPSLEYKDSCAFATRVVDAKIDIGAYEYSTSLSLQSEINYLFQVFPNPNNGRFSCIGDATIESIEIINTVGQICFSQNGLTSNNIEIEGLSKGLYSLCCKSKGQLQILKIVVQ
jgi:hypothetical protein